MTVTTRKKAQLLVAIALGLAVAGSANAASPAYSDFEPMGDYILEIGGEVHAEARMYSSSQARAILVVSSRLPSQSPVLLWPGSFVVNSVNLMKMAKRDDGSIDLLPGAVVGNHPKMQVRNGSDVVFTIEGVEGVIKPKPALLGFQGIDSLASHSPEYRTRADFYTPRQESLAALKAQSKDVRVQVYFGTWCPACGQMVPRIMKVAEGLSGSKVQVQFYGLPRGIVSDERAERYKVKSVPTGIVYVDGAEVGRITGNEWRSPEQTLAAMIGG